MYTYIYVYAHTHTHTYRYIQIFIRTAENAYVRVLQCVLHTYTYSAVFVTAYPTKVRNALQHTATQTRTREDEVG